MAAVVRYTPTYLRKLSEDEIRRIVIEDGLKPLDTTHTKEELITYYLNYKNGKNRASLPAPFSAGVVLGPVNEVYYSLLEYYDQKVNVARQLNELCDAALFAVCDKLGHEVKMTEPYVLVNGMRIDTRDALIWYLVGLRSA